MGSMTYMCAVRGAIQLPEDSEDNMDSAVWLLISSLLDQNEIQEKDIISIHFSQTNDLISANPAHSLRKRGFKETALFCSLEPTYTRALPRIVRTLLYYHTTRSHKPQPLYLGGAAQLRPDLNPEHSLMDTLP